MIPNILCSSVPYELTFAPPALGGSQPPRAAQGYRAPPGLLQLPRSVERT